MLGDHVIGGVLDCMSRLGVEQIVVRDMQIAIAAAAIYCIISLPNP